VVVDFAMDVFAKVLARANDDNFFSMKKATFIAGATGLIGLTSLLQRRWLRFSIRSLLAVVAVVCLLLGWWSSSAMKQARAAAAITSLGGNVTYDYQSRTGVFIRNATPSGPIWLRSLLGRDWFDTVHGVGLPGQRKVFDGDIASELLGLPHTRSLQLDMTRVGDRTLKSVRRMSKLIHLSLFATQITDDGLPNLYGLKNLTALDVRHTALTAKGIAQLRAALPDCKIIAIDADLR
jgi:hypothetical protein